ncbi:4Fe-4S binding protein [Desulfuromonas acetoxidans]|uniref:Ferredoxin n=1 Tax=Desulfuromonas acetoxidans (strain DSM 684 / 11070) TaxID=281689 RepID=Q1JZ07_DESA6|nr:4Fe-4S binding protein [Desulfuromonas acetoxidans]EAT15487.1 4Fe-4S ferredoxin, iron-sulfur binding [Desulfuromonas acetoxidans DSM 684]MBF0646673.1 4Fe-4S binding protein [Desulfuromonas acetoxidans]NVD25776.1 4Fe-4S binding protein [Desulfuromonas acetoxidans]NVE17754.1 4Fe-4S binding protein [Desulfuromonas acetoxidans]
MSYRILEEDCTACGECEPVCPVDCISAKDNGKRLINEEECIDCGACADACPVDCIYQHAH